MTNDELKKKIVEVVLNSEITGIQIRAITGGYSMANNIADALIAAGIGDVSEWKHRAEVAEIALQYAVSEYRCDECPCLDCNAEIRGSIECIDCICEEYKKQAEKELQEDKE